MNEPNQTTENKVMEQITTGQVKLRSKYVFLAEKLGIGSAIILSVLFAILFFNLFLYYLRATDNLSFGKNGIFAFLESFPYLLVIALIVCIFVAGVLLKTSDSVYRRPFKYIALGLVAVILALGSVLTYTHVAELIEMNVYNNSGSGVIFQPFLHPGLNERNRGITGRVIEVSPDYILVQTPRGIRKVDTTRIPPQDKQTAVNMFIVGIGERQDEIFVARYVHEVKPGDTPMIERGIGRRFGPPPFSSSTLNLQIRQCLDACHENQGTENDCPEACFPTFKNEMK